MASTTVRTVKSFIHGAHIAGRGARRCLLDPSTKLPVTEFHDLDNAQVQEAVKSAVASQSAWANLSPANRGAILRRAASIISENTKEFEHLECIDTGRVIAEMEADIVNATECLEYFAGIAPSIGGQMLDVHSPNWAYTRREPYGVTAGIGAWNYPLQSAVWKSAPALAFGNAMIFKPSEETPLTAVRLAEVYAEAGVPPGVFNVVLGGGEVGSTLVSNEAVRKVSFTGSVATGRKVYTACAQQLKPATMELGGKSALLIFSDADLHEAVSGAMLANWYSNGQVCSNATRIFVHSSIYEKFVDLFVSRTAALRIGNHEAPESQVGPMINEAQLNKVKQYIDYGEEDGATLAYGGTVPSGFEQGNYILPTIFTNCNDNMRIVKEEIFGMVACVLPFDDEEEVIVRANASPFGLSAGIFTNDLRRAHRVLQQLQVGTSWVNTYNIAPVEIPWGGYKQSGIGRENGIAGADAWTQLKSVYVEMGSTVPCPYE